MEGGGGGSAVSLENMPPLEIAMRLAGCTALLGMSALFSGMTLGVMGLDITQLKLVMDAGSPKDRERAAKIMPIRKSGNMLLCVLLSGNVLVNSCLSIIMADLTSGLVGLIVSTILIVVLGELIPQAACSRHALKLGSLFVPVISLLTILFYPFCKPLAMLLDKWLGEEAGLSYSRQELDKLLAMHVQSNKLDATEAQIMKGALHLKQVKVRDVMTPVARMYSLRSSDRLDFALMARIFRTGYSRIPVWNAEGSAIAGVLYAKDLMLVDPSARLPVIAVLYFFNRQRVNVCDDEDSLADVLLLFKSSRQHFSVVRCVDDSDASRDPVYKVGGVIGFNDLFEQILQEDLDDEYDSFRDGGGAGAGAAGAEGQGQGMGGAADGSGNGGAGAAMEQDMSARAARETAALMRMNETQALELAALGLVGAGAGVAGGPGEGGLAGPSSSSSGAKGSGVSAAKLGGAASLRGPNNQLNGSELRALAAHLLANVSSFHSPVMMEGTGAGAASSSSKLPAPSFEASIALLARCRVLDLVSPWQPLPSGMAPAYTEEGLRRAAKARRTAELHGGPAEGAAAAAAAAEGHKEKDSRNKVLTVGSAADPSSFGANVVPLIVSGAADAVETSAAAAANEGGATTAPSGTAAAALPSAAPSSAQLLYERGLPSSHCTVILEGQLELLVGSEAIPVLRGPWEVVGERALSWREGSYRPDFSARAASPVVRCLRISQGDFLAACLASMPSSAAAEAAAAVATPAVAAAFASFRSTVAAEAAGGRASGSGLSRALGGENMASEAEVAAWIGHRQTSLPPDPLSALADAVFPSLGSETHAAAKPFRHRTASGSSTSGPAAAAGTGAAESAGVGTLSGAGAVAAPAQAQVAFPSPVLGGSAPSPAVRRRLEMDADGTAGGLLASGAQAVRLSRAPSQGSSSKAAAMPEGAAGTGADSVQLHMGASSSSASAWAVQGHVAQEGMLEGESATSGGAAVEGEGSQSFQYQLEEDQLQQQPQLGAAALQQQWR